MWVLPKHDAFCSGVPIILQYVGIDEAGPPLQELMCLEERLHRCWVLVLLESFGQMYGTQRDPFFHMEP